jgi:hypothetical protein
LSVELGCSLDDTRARVCQGVQSGLGLVRRGDLGGRRECHRPGDAGTAGGLYDPLDGRGGLCDERPPPSNDHRMPSKLRNASHRLNLAAGGFVDAV